MWREDRADGQRCQTKPGLSRLSTDAALESCFDNHEIHVYIPACRGADEVSSDRERFRELRNRHSEPSAILIVSQPPSGGGSRYGGRH